MRLSRPGSPTGRSLRSFGARDRKMQPSREGWHWMMSWTWRQESGQECYPGRKQLANRQPGRLQEPMRSGPVSRSDARYAQGELQRWPGEGVSRCQQGDQSIRITHLLHLAAHKRIGMELSLSKSQMIRLGLFGTRKGKSDDRQDQDDGEGQCRGSQHWRGPSARRPASCTRHVRKECCRMYRSLILGSKKSKK